MTKSWPICGTTASCVRFLSEFPRKIQTETHQRQCSSDHLSRLWILMKRVRARIWPHEIKVVYDCSFADCVRSQCAQKRFLSKTQSQNLDCLGLSWILTQNSKPEFEASAIVCNYMAVRRGIAQDAGHRLIASYVSHHEPPASALCVLQRDGFLRWISTLRQVKLASFGSN